MIITHKLKPMDLSQKQNTGRVDVVQGDKYSRNIEFTFMCNGSAWQIPDGTTAIVRYKKPDATGGNYDTLPDGSRAYQINGNVLTVCLAPQVCTVPGIVQLSVGLIQGSAEINTFSINIVVQANPGAKYQSEDYITAISGSPIVDDSLENTVQYRQMNATAAEFIANVDYTENANDYSITKVTPYYSAATYYSKEEPRGLQIKVPANTTLTVAQGDKTRSDVVSGDGVIYNIEPLKAGTFSFGGKTYKIVAEGGVRMIYTPSVWNVRDLGGWECTGGRVKYGKIFRGGHFGSITDADKSTLVDWLGIKTDIDLRNNSETGSITTSPLGGSVEYFHQSLDFYANAVSTSEASARTVSVLKKVMACVAANKPCYFHCMSGADRTGTIAYLLLSLLGVSQSDKDKEYELTAFSDEADGKRFRNTNYNVTNGNGWYPLIKYFRDTYTGENDNEKVVAWAVANGITDEEINAFRDAMISGNAGEVVVPPQEYTVTNTLTGCTSSNAATTVTEGDVYYATITANSGYTMSGATVQVKMGGTVVTELYYANGIINIPDVSGNIEITITAAVYVPSYTNVLPTAVDPSTKSGVWDGKGYRNGAYVS